MTSNDNKQKIEKKIGEALGLEMAAQKAVEELSRFRNWSFAKRSTAYKDNCREHIYSSIHSVIRAKIATYQNVIRIADIEDLLQYN